MARTGILYSELANAAARLAADGKNPTVDSVRIALGSTGSKSTIAPLLKRWKAEHQDSLIETTQGLGLPAPLLQAMKGIHEKLQDDVLQQLEQARDAHHVALLAAHGATQQAEDGQRVLQDDKAALSAELEQTRESRRQLEEHYQAICIRQASLQAEHDGAQQRLSDRAAEVAALHVQLTQARTQFDHYHEAAAEQRTQEQQAGEQRAMRLEQELAGLRQQHVQQQSAIARYETRITQLQDVDSQLNASLQRAEEARDTIRSERDRLASKIADLSSENGLLHQKLDAAQEATTDMRMTLASQAGQTELMAGQIAGAERKITELDSLRLGLLEERAGWQARVRRYEALEQQAAVISNGGQAPVNPEK